MSPLTALKQQHVIDELRSDNAELARAIEENSRLQAERVYLASIVEFSNDAIISIDMQGLVTSWNRAAWSMFGYEKAEIVGRLAALLFPSDRLHEEGEILRLDNAKGGKLGKPLPAGQVTMTEIIGGGPVLAGQPQIDDTPIGVPLELKGSMTQVVSARLRDVTVAINIPGGIASRDHEVTITNRKAVAATFEWSVPSYPGIRVTAESQKHGARAGRLVWSVALKPHSQTKLHYKVQWQS